MERLTREDWRNPNSTMWEKVEELSIENNIKKSIKDVLRKLAKYEDREELQHIKGEKAMEKLNKNNKVTIKGEIVSGFTFSHEIFGEGFYMMDVKCKRLSDAFDTIPVMVSERLMDVEKDYSGQLISVSGQFRSYNRHEDRKNRLILSVFAREIEFLDEVLCGSESNQIFLDGYVCKEPVYRKTPLGREIADVLLAVNRPYGKSDYIPCICWGRNARYASYFEIGERMCVSGRIQSREYVKKLDDENVERRVAYEVSVSRITEDADEQE